MNCFLNSSSCFVYTNYSTKYTIQWTNNVVLYFSQLPPQSNTAESTSAVTDTATLATSISDSSSLWSFDYNTLDSLSNFDGVAINSPTYRTPGINGYGTALSVIGSSDQYVNVPTYRNLVARSFTIEIWFYSTNLTSNGSGLFGQFYVTTTNQSLHCLIRQNVVHFAFYTDDLMGSSVIQINIWYHVAFVFDYSSLTKKIYLNEILDGNQNSSHYQGLNGSIVIGKTEEVPDYPQYFSGYIDQVSLVMRAKNASEILIDATLVSYHSFDNESYSDSGPLNLLITVANVTSVIGRVNQAISFTSNLSYYQVYGFVLLGVSGYTYSIALWTCPSSIKGSVLVHYSTRTDGNGWCVDLIGFSSTGHIVVTGWGPGLGVEVVGPILPANVWTHVVATYSQTNALRLYINGTYYNSSVAFIFAASEQANILTLANPLQAIQSTVYGGSCNSQSILPSVYYGYIDEFRVYSRELNMTDIYTLANGSLN